MRMKDKKNEKDWIPFNQFVYISEIMNRPISSFHIKILTAEQFSPSIKKYPELVENLKNHYYLCKTNAEWNIRVQVDQFTLEEDREIVLLLNKFSDVLNKTYYSGVEDGIAHAVSALHDMGKI